MATVSYKFKCIDCSATVWRENTRCKKHSLQHRYPNKRTREDKLAYMKAYHARLKDLVFEAYGGYVCVCCGETAKVFLVIDHIYGGGNAERKKIRTEGGAGQYDWLVKNNFPSGYQVLCHNCNYAKTRGVCPHAVNKQKATEVYGNAACETTQDWTQ